MAFRSIPEANKICSEKWRDRAYQIHKQRLNSMKPAIDNKPPTKYTHLVQNLKKAQLEEERYSEIERENRILLEKMSTIMQQTHFHARSGSAQAPRSLNKEYRKRELMRITSENQAILKRIQHKEPYYNHLQWEEDRKQNEVYLSMICNYPVSLGGRRGIRTASPGKMYRSSSRQSSPMRGETSHSHSRSAGTAPVRHVPNTGNLAEEAVPTDGSDYEQDSADER
eukprot:GFYU01002067.1.p1 GENE.GFYU01002067.1~~GFYU01002067.1.p1  ORF type:complete len:225 (-),score=32.01 GFYU01002067.1:524-1198(-)